MNDFFFVGNMVKHFTSKLRTLKMRVFDIIMVKLASLIVLSKEKDM